jgi:hypothetical protein
MLMPGCCGLRQSAWPSSASWWPGDLRRLDTTVQPEHNGGGRDGDQQCSLDHATTVQGPAGTPATPWSLGRHRGGSGRMADLCRQGRPPLGDHPSRLVGQAGSDTSAHLPRPHPRGRFVAVPDRLGPLVCAGACAARDACGWCPAVGVGVPSHRRHRAVRSPSIPAATAVVRFTHDEPDQRLVHRPARLCHPVPGCRPQLRGGDRPWRQRSAFPPNGGGTGAPKPASCVTVHMRLCRRRSRLRTREAGGGGPGRSVAASGTRTCAAVDEEAIQRAADPGVGG